MNRKNSGFTLIELLVVIGIIAVLAGAVILAVNPARQFAQARNSQRVTHVNQILDAIGQNIADNKGIFTCAAGAIATSTPTQMATSTYDIGPCLVSNYLPSMPFDPSATGALWVSVTDYDTGYKVQKDATTSRITVSAPSAELSQSISITR